VIELVLHEIRSHLRAIRERKRELQRTVESELLAEAAVRGVDRVLPRRRMGAARVRPQPAGMVFVERPLLDQHLRSGRVEDEDRDRAVQNALDVRELLFTHTDLVVVLVDEDDVRHADNVRLLNRERPACSIRPARGARIFACASLF
jgi:hypothetical protein